MGRPRKKKAKPHKKGQWKSVKNIAEIKEGIHFPLRKGLGSGKKDHN